MTATSPEPTFDDLSTAVDQLAVRVSELAAGLDASRAVNAALLEEIDDKSREIEVCHGEIGRLNLENADLHKQIKQARQQRLDDPPRRWALGRGRIGNSL